MTNKPTTQQLRQISVVFRRGELFKIKGLLFEVESADFKRGRLHLRTVDDYKVTPPTAVTTGKIAADPTMEPVPASLSTLTQTATNLDPAAKAPDKSEQMLEMLRSKVKVKGGTSA